MSQTDDKTDGRSMAAFMVTVVLLVVALVALMSLWEGNQGSQSATGPGGLTASTYNSSLGLKLSIEVNTTSVRPNGSVLLTIDLVNSWSRPNNASAAADWHNLTRGGCPTLGRPFGIALLRGYYSLSNISLGTPLDIINLDFCQFNVAVPGAYTFLPNSNWAVANGSESHQAEPMNSTATISNCKFYFTNGMTWGPCVSFKTGTYTLVCVDEWGQLAVLQLEVE